MVAMTIQRHILHDWDHKTRNKEMKVLVLGGDGFCGWPTSLRLINSGHEVMIVDNLSRREIDVKLKSRSLTDIADVAERVSKANEIFGNISFRKINITTNRQALKELLLEFKPDAIVHFAEQRAAPYSMIGDAERCYTVENNVVGTHNVCSAIIETGLDIHLVHLGTMGVYGYSKEFGKIPEGYLDVTINQTDMATSILYPANPGSVYHMTKCLDQLIFQFYNKNWGLKITDLHQGIVWGINTKETIQDEVLQNRFDYDGIYGTVLNRFISQAANQVPLTVYGTGGQQRAFIHISDTAECIKIALERKNDHSKVRIFNQVAEVLSVRQLAELVAKNFNVEINFLENPRKELAENELEVSNSGLVSLGFKPITLEQSLIDDVYTIANKTSKNFNVKNVKNSPKW